MQSLSISRMGRHTTGRESVEGADALGDWAKVHGQSGREGEGENGIQMKFWAGATRGNSLPMGAAEL